LAARSLGQARHAHEQGVAAAKHRHQNLFDHRLLAYDHLADFLLHSAIHRMEFIDGCFIVVAHDERRLLRARLDGFAKYA